MREIKFRAWDKYNKTMHPDCYYGGDQKGVNDIIAMFAEDMVWMQYTGLKDKNGKEIYEGDVVLNNDIRWEIVWKDCGWHMQEVGKPSNGYIFLVEHPYSEVIGNIYENEDLITGV